MTQRLLIGISIALFACTTLAGKYNSTLDIGDAAPHWTDLPGVDGQSHSSSELEDAKATVVVFTCNSCPYAVDAEDRLIALTKKYSDQGVAVVAINVNKVPEDSLDAMKEKAAEKKFPFQYLYDESQQIARDFGAIYTPCFFVIDSKHKVAYMGAMDDSPDGVKVETTYLADALDAVLAGKPVRVAETAPVGCRVRYERQRRSRRAE
ncbi:thioredoxin family protein [Stieleria varia]|uniref:Thiol-disulfide oxidoreductase n=1 Tax=Stieleria varia TaxID=2528005 RepID=A0A5C6BB43_9BACT|nr:thioredoxin family protein [Stieleria varia]TWU07734.1 thiol-disulfide oxidoreductase [Stieleria varia]